MICSKCKKITDERCFATYRDRKGVIRRRGICQECRSKQSNQTFEEMQEWRKKYNKKNRTKREKDQLDRRQIAKKVVDKIKSETPCKDCGRNFHPVAMDFDHIKGKNRSIASLVSGAYKIDLILEEIKLCEVVCACCHRLRTHSRKENHCPRKGKYGYKTNTLVEPA